MLLVQHADIDIDIDVEGGWTANPQLVDLKGLSAPIAGLKVSKMTPEAIERERA